MASSGFAVMDRLCSTCIYRGDLDWNLEHLEDQVRDKHMGFKGYRICHHQKRGGKACCRGFWNAHRNEFAAGQIAQRLNLVTFVTPTGEPK
jgi:hypothetical protein